MPARIAISGQLHLNRPPGQLFLRTPLLYSPPTFAPMSAPSAVEGPRPLFRLISKARILPPHGSPPAVQSSSFSVHTCTGGSIFYHFVFIHLQIPPRATPLYSHPCKTLGVSPCASFRPQEIAHHKITSHAVSEACGLFISLAPLFRPPVLYFQSFAHSFAKTPGWVGHEDGSCFARRPPHRGSRNRVVKVVACGDGARWRLPKRS